MKRIFLLTISIALFVSAQAQLVPTQDEAWLHITPNATVKKLIDLDNTGSTAVNTSWEVVTDEVKGVAAWDIEFCDCNNCYSTKDYPVSDSCDVGIPSNDYHTYSLQVEPGNTIQNGDFQVVVYNLDDPAETDTMTFKVRDAAATGLVQQFYESGYKLSPNPSNNEIKISGLAENETIKVYNVAGSLIMTTIESNVDVSNLQTGAYILEVSSETSMSRQRFMKE